jgi:hypothetical protein
LLVCNYSLFTSRIGGPASAPGSNPPTVQFVLKRSLNGGIYSTIATSPVYTGSRTQSGSGTFFTWTQTLEAEFEFTDNFNLGSNSADYKLETNIVYNMQPLAQDTEQRLDLISLEQ